MDSMTTGAWIGELRLNRSRSLSPESKPIDDKFKWYMLRSNGEHWSFEFTMEDPEAARYGQPFKVRCSFLAGRDVMGKILLNTDYDVLRGQELVGTIRLIDGPTDESVR